MLQLILGRPLSLGSQPLPDPLQTYLDPGSMTHPNITRDCLLVLATQPLKDLSRSTWIQALQPFLALPGLSDASQV